MVAALSGSIESTRYLLSVGAASTARSEDDDLRTPLHCAATSGSANSAEIIETLLLYGADRNALDAGGRAPLDVLVTHPNSRSNAEKVGPNPQNTPRFRFGTGNGGDSSGATTSGPSSLSRGDGSGSGTSSDDGRSSGESAGTSAGTFSSGAPSSSETLQHSNASSETLMERGAADPTRAPFCIRETTLGASRPSRSALGGGGGSNSNSNSNSNSLPGSSGASDLSSESARTMGSSLTGDAQSHQATGLIHPNAPLGGAPAPPSASGNNGDVSRAGRVFGARAPFGRLPHVRV